MGNGRSLSLLNEADSATAHVRGGVRRRLGEASSSFGLSGTSAPLLQTRRDWGQGKLSAKQVVDYMKSAEQQGAEGLPRVSSMNHPQNLHRSLVAAFGKLKGSPDFVWVELPITKGVMSHPFLLPHMWFAELHSSSSQSWEDLLGERGAIPFFWRKMAESPFLRHHPHLAKANLKFTVPLGLHGDAGAFSNNDSLYVFSWNSLVHQGITRDTRHVITLIKKSLITEGTLDVISKVMGWSFNVLLSAVHPSADWDGRDMEGGDAYLAQKYRGALSQVRGDWEFFGSFLGLPKWSETQSMCWLCEASGMADRLRYSNHALDAPWRATRRTHEKFLAGLAAKGKDVAPIFKHTKGLRLECVMIDVLHTADLGVTAHILGNILWECVVAKVWGEATQDGNVAECMKAIEQFYKHNKTTSKLQGKLTVDRLRTTGGWPKLKSKAAAARHLVPFAVGLARLHLDERRLALCLLLERFYVILNHEGQFLSDHAKVELPRLGLRLCVLFSQLASEAAMSRQKLWKTSPKLHLFQHVCEWQSIESGNPRFYWCYADEDLVGQLIEVAEACHAKTMAVTTMYKWLTLVFASN